MATFPLHYRHIAEQAKSAKTRRRVQPAPALVDTLRQNGNRYLTVLQLINRDGEKCYLCDQKLEPGRFDVDHIIPRSKGGTDHPLNLALACSICNRRKLDLIVAFDIADRRPIFRLP